MKVKGTLPESSYSSRPVPLSSKEESGGLGDGAKSADLTTPNTVLRTQTSHTHTQEHIKSTFPVPFKAYFRKQRHLKALPD